ncbi:MAG: hypothetical protein L0Z73_10515 [Gammaproteobacteria bacterium]|nr:hypothetical protein [Gammaproteobacteria bacterium]
MPKKNILQSIMLSSPVGLEAIHVHPCVIDNRPHIVYPKGLAEDSPELFARLRHHYTHLGYALKEDQRTRDNAATHHPERRRWAPILLFTASLLFESNANAEMELEIHEHFAAPTQQVELHLVSNHPVRSQIKQQFGLPDAADTTVPATLHTGIAQELFGILQTHYAQQDNDPVHIIDDLKQIANYYSEFPEVINMLGKLQHEKWLLKYNEDNWMTVASGNVFQVEQAVIHFNTRAAAQLRLNNKCKENPVCIASPADALLHELLHAYSMLINTEQFIAQGGMSNVMYPFTHEYAVIETERKLYASMSKRDEIKRPQRTDHTGRTVKAHCPTCIK